MSHPGRPRGDGREAEPVAAVVLRDGRARRVRSAARARTREAARACARPLLAAGEEEASIGKGAVGGLVPREVVAFSVLEAGVLAGDGSLEGRILCETLIEERLRDLLVFSLTMWPWYKIFERLM